MNLLWFHIKLRLKTLLKLFAKCALQAILSRIATWSEMGTLDAYQIDFEKLSKCTFLVRFASINNRLKKNLLLFLSLYVTFSLIFYIKLNRTTFFDLLYIIYYKKSRKLISFI